MSELCGKHRGTVLNNADPAGLGRVQVSVPSVGASGFALPAAPFAGDGVGFVALPPVGANVWVEFEDGDVDFPVWSGCFWAPGELPAEATGPAVKVLKTERATMVIDDAAGTLVLRTSDGASITVGDTVVLEKGSSRVVLDGNLVTVNNGGLVVL